MNDLSMIEDIDDEEVQIETPSLSSKTSTSSSLIAKKKRGIFRKEWLSIERYSVWLQETTYDFTKAKCKACAKVFSVHADGKSAVEKPHDWSGT